MYIAGPFRGKTEWDRQQNIRRAEALALEVWKLGAAAICPHKNTEHFDGSAPDELWLKGDIEILLRCNAVILTDNWHLSSGAREEFRMAQKWNIPIFFTVHGLKEWLLTSSVHPEL